MMKNLYNYILLAMMAFATVGCLGELNTDIPSAESGDEVQFGLSLPSMTRTTYGDKNATGTAYPIYWVDGDKVQVYSPQCLAGRNNAEYKVSVESATQNYATSLTPTGANGVQWGNEPAMFYSVYPSGNYTILNNGATIQNLKINFMNDFEVLENGVVTPKGADCLMFAKTAGELDPGSTVNLNYSPLATSLMITLRGPSDKSIVREHTIQSIKLIAPENTFIAGSFNVELTTVETDSEGKAVKKYVHTGWSDAAQKSNSITAQVYDKSTSAFHTIKKDEKLEIAMFLAPLTGLTIDGTWKIEVVVQSDIPVIDGNGNVESYKNDVTTTFTKSLTFENGFNGTLKPGMVHELPALPTLDIAKDSEPEWQPGDWMTHVPRNVYLSEVSIPGSWNSINPDFQDVGSTDAETIANQYAQGVRAFHLDTRWKAEYNTFLGFPSSVKKVLGLGVADGGANGSANSGTITSGDKYMRGDDTPLVEDIIRQLVGYIKNTPEEYMVLVCSFAQESINYEGSNGLWYGEISAICNKSDYTDYIVDGTKVTANTLVGDVLGKILVIINMQGTISATTTLPIGSKCMFVNMPSELTSTRFTPLDNQETLLENNTDYLWYSATTATSTGISMYNNQAQITSSTGSAITDHDRGYVPSINQRSAVLNSIVNWSRSNYGTENYAHDTWIYLGLGGYQVNAGDNAGAVSGSYSTIASTYNTWINGKVTEMGTIPTGQTVKVPYYPVGIVLMNFVNDYVSTVKNILLLNNAYRLQYDPDKPSDYKPALTSTAASYSSGMHDQNVAAFGWD